MLVEFWGGPLDGRLEQFPKLPPLTLEVASRDHRYESASYAVTHDGDPVPICISKYRLGSNGHGGMRYWWKGESKNL